MIDGGNVKNEFAVSFGCGAWGRCVLRFELKKKHGALSGQPVNNDFNLNSNAGTLPYISVDDWNALCALADIS